MTLHTFDNIAQGTDEWHDLRRGIVTGSVIKGLVTPSTVKPASNPESRSIVAILAAERITGHTDETYIGDDMVRGWDDEPRAVEKYAEHYAPVTSVGFMVRDDWGFSIGYSPDGLVGEDGLIEVKSRRPKKHLQDILADAVPIDVMPQIQCGLLVSGREWCDYISFCAGMRMWHKRVYPDPAWHEAIVAAVAKFETTAAEMVAAYEQATTDMPQTERIDHNDLGLVF